LSERKLSQDSIDKENKHLLSVMQSSSSSIHSLKNNFDDFLDDDDDNTTSINDSFNLDINKNNQNNSNKNNNSNNNNNTDDENHNQNSNTNKSNFTKNNEYNANKTTNNSSRSTKFKKSIDYFGNLNLEKSPIGKSSIRKIKKLDSFEYYCNTSNSYTEDDNYNTDINNNVSINNNLSISPSSNNNPNSPNYYSQQNQKTGKNSIITKNNSNPHSTTLNSIQQLSSPLSYFEKQNVDENWMFEEISAAGSTAAEATINSEETMSKKEKEILFVQLEFCLCELFKRVFFFKFFIIFFF
jgi:hypothetical protein